MKIALDAMGGDHAPAAEVEGAALAVREYGVEVVLVGDDTLLKAELRRQGVGDLPGLTVHHASQRVEMHEQPSQVVRRKRDSSIWVGTELVKKGEAVAIISAGNTGATVVTAFFLLGVLKRSEEHTSELQSRSDIVCRLLLEKKKKELRSGPDHGISVMDIVDP